MLTLGDNAEYRMAGLKYPTSLLRPALASGHCAVLDSYSLSLRFCLLRVTISHLCEMDLEWGKGDLRPLNDLGASASNPALLVNHHIVLKEAKQAFVLVAA